jgi:ribokinase
MKPEAKGSSITAAGHKRNKVFVIGSLNIDFVVRASRLPREGETILGHAFSKFPGGKGANQSTGIARLGGNVFHIGKIGMDEHGEILLKSLSDAGVDVKGIIQNGSTPTGIAFIQLSDSGANTIIVIPGANMRLEPSDLDTIIRSVKTGDIILIQNEIPMHTNMKAARIGREFGAFVIYNPAPYREISAEICSLAHFIVCNEIELSQLTELSTSTNSDVVKASRFLMKKRQTKSVIATLGSRGCMVTSRKSAEFIPAISVAVKDTTGAGDAFIAGLAFSLSQKSDLLEAVRFATEVAGYSVTILGAQPSLPTLDQLNKFRANGYRSAQ